MALLGGGDARFRKNEQEKRDQVGDKIAKTWQVGSKVDGLYRGAMCRSSARQVDGFMVDTWGHHCDGV